MLSKVKFLEIVQQVYKNKNLKNEEKKLFEKIINNEDQLLEEVTAETLIKGLGLIDIKTITNEEGHFKEFVNTINDNEIKSETKIFYLLKDKQVSCLHALNTTETWTWLAGNAISLFVNTKQELKEIILNKNNPSFTIEKGSIFGAKITASKNNDFGLVICHCEPGFEKEHYINPTSEQIDNLYKSYPKYNTVIDELKPKIPEKNKNFFTHRGKTEKIEEQTPLINSPKNTI